MEAWLLGGTRATAPQRPEHSQTPMQGPEGRGGFREHGREDPVCHGELWQPR